LDICTGSGAMGAEALCRGAAAVIGIEQMGAACAVIQANWQQLAQPHQRHQLLRGDVRKMLKTLAGEQFDRIYFDPPYDGDLYRAVLGAIVDHGLLAPRGELAVEHRPGQLAELVPAGLSVIREKRYGTSAVTFLTRAELD
jgi:16S rRNA (guanine966-N2)-methyltransferase